MSQMLPSDALREAIGHWQAAGMRVAGPRRSSGSATLHGPLRPAAGDQVRYSWLENADQLVMEDVLRPVNSIKQFFLPPHETLFCYRGQGRRVELAAEQLPSTPRVIVAARPCDAAALPILDQVFNWDCADAPYNRRRELTTVLVLACREHDEHCFCTSVGLGPRHEQGADALLIPLDHGGWEVRLVTGKGEQLLKPLLVSSRETAAPPAAPPPRFELPAVQRFLADGFQHPLWKTASLRCLGCGACAHNCPACHCFDIVDQPAGDGGRRVRNWDSCQSRLYSLHASGHNPRGSQADRQRNRVFHKYRTYPEKFGTVLCTGCGACSRNCPVQLGTLSVLEQIAETT